jgi:hypothetical protein
MKKTGPLVYSRPTGARVALLRSPILPAATREIPGRGRSVQPQITLGEGALSGSDGELSPDISIATKMRTFLLRSDNRLLNALHFVWAGATMAGSYPLTQGTS